MFSNHLVNYVACALSLLLSSPVHADEQKGAKILDIFSDAISWVGYVNGREDTVLLSITLAKDTDGDHRIDHIYQSHLVLSDAMKDPYSSRFTGRVEKGAFRFEKGYCRMGE